MYIQITEKCNMTCDHCCFSATAKGDVMERYTFMAALQLAARHGEYITIGGGEPTTHKEFFAFLDKAIELYEANALEYPPFLVTNGKLKGKTMKLLDYVEDERPLHVCLSQDSFHDPIDPAVVQRFRRHQERQDRWGYSRSGGNENSSASIRRAIEIKPWGRAKETGVWTTDAYSECVCDDVFVDPKGRVWSCGCKHTQLGWVWQDGVLDDYDRDFAHQGGKDPEPECANDLEGLGLPSLDIDLAACSDKSDDTVSSRV